jgi:hypothetical protein
MIPGGKLKVRKQRANFHQGLGLLLLVLLPETKRVESFSRATSPDFFSELA